MLSISYGVRKLQWNTSITSLAKLTADFAVPLIDKIVRVCAYLQCVCVCTFGTMEKGGEVRSGLSGTHWGLLLVQFSCSLPQRAPLPPRPSSNTLLNTFQTGGGLLTIGCRHTLNIRPLARQTKSSVPSSWEPVENTNDIVPFIALEIYRNEQVVSKFFKMNSYNTDVIVIFFCKRRKNYTKDLTEVLDSSIMSESTCVLNIWKIHL